jgi:hypothetical protein
MVQLDLQLSMQSVPITTHVLSSNPVQMYSIQLYVMKFVSDLRQVGVYEWSDMSTSELMLQWDRTIKIQLILLV